MHFDLLCLCYCAILVQMEYREFFASIVGYIIKTDARVKCTDNVPE